MRSAAAERGFTYLGVMFLVVTLSLTAAMASLVVDTVQRRDKERELLFVGRQFQAAIERYQARPGVGPAQYPRRLEDLLRDDRGTALVRHLRRIHVDPMTGAPAWGLLRQPDGGIVGVHSLSDRRPLPGTLWSADFAAGGDARYRDWRFEAAGVANSNPAPAQGASTAPR